MAGISPSWTRGLLVRFANSRFAQTLGLASFGLLSILHSLRFLGYGGPIDKPPQGLEFLKDAFPLWVYAALWGFAGFLCIIGMIWRLFTWWGIMAAWGMMTIWWMFYFSGYIYAITHDRPSAIYYIAGLYFSLSLIPLHELLKMIREEAASAGI